MNSSNGSLLSDKHSETISPRLHQLVRLGPDGRPEIVGRIGMNISVYNTNNVF